MRIDRIPAVLKSLGLRDTRPRRMVLCCLADADRPLSPQDIHERIRSVGRSVNLVTVYRVLEALEETGLVHRHPCDGGITLCTRPGTGGHHGFLHCVGCGQTQEFVSEELARAEDVITSRIGFVPASRMSELTGRCAACAR